MPDGFTERPEPVEQAGEDSPIETVALASVRCLVLLGEAGTGKTTEIQRLARATRDAGVAVEVVHLAAWPSASELVDDLCAREGWRQWRAGGATLHLFLDALDEGLLSAPRLAEAILSVLAGTPTARLWLRITCRTGAWSPRLEEALRSLYGEGDERFRVMELLPLDRISAADLASAWFRRRNAGAAEERAARLFAAVQRLRIEPLAARPVTLRMLSELHARELPTDRVSLYEGGLRCLLTEWDIARVRRRPPEPSTPDPLVAASWIAAALVLGNCAALCERKRMPEVERIALDDIAAVSRIPKDELHTTAVSEAFTLVEEAGDDGWIRTFAHRSFAEFLAARFLHMHDAAPAILQEVLGSAGRIAPQMEEVAAWLCSLDEGWLATVIRTQPEVILRGDPAALSEAARHRTLDAILDACAAGDLQDNTTGWENHLSALDFPGVERVLGPWIKGEAPSSGPTMFVARRVAIDAAEAVMPTLAARDPRAACELVVHLAEVAATVDDRTPDTNVRTAAAWAVRHLVKPPPGRAPLQDPSVTRTGEACIRRLLSLPEEEDPDDELRGVALMTLFPEHISSSELPSMLPHLPRRGSFGAYNSFLSYDLPAALRTDLKLVGELCRWLAGRLERELEDDDSWTASDRFTEHLVEVAALNWPHAEVARRLPRLLLALATHHMAAKLPEDMLTAPTRRRSLLAAMLGEWVPRRWEHLLTCLMTHGQQVEARADYPSEHLLVGELKALATTLGAVREQARLLQLQSECAGRGRYWFSDAFAVLHRAAPTKRDNWLDHPIAWHLTVRLATVADLDHWIARSAEERDPLLREEFIDVARQIVDVENDDVVRTVREAIAPSVGIVREHLEWAFGPLLTDEALEKLRAERAKHRTPKPVGPADGKSPQTRLEELLTQGESEPVRVWPWVLRTLPMTPDHERWGDPYHDDLRTFPTWKAAPEETRSRILAMGRAFLSLAEPNEDTWLGKSSFPSILLAAVRAFQLLAVCDDARPDLGLSPEVWAKWATTLLEKAGMLPPWEISTRLQERLAGMAPHGASRVLELIDAAVREGKPTDATILTDTAVRVMVPAVGHGLIDRLRRRVLPPEADARLLRLLVGRGDPDATHEALARLARGAGATQDHRSNAILALLRRGLRHGEWPQVWEALQQDDAVVGAVFAGNGDLQGGPGAAGWGEIPARELGKLYERVSEVYPPNPEEEDLPRGGGFVPVTGRMEAARAREAIVVTMQNRATAEDVEELGRLARQHQQRALYWQRAQAQATMGRATWRPMALVELVAHLSSAQTTETRHTGEGPGLAAEPYRPMPEHETQERAGRATIPGGEVRIVHLHAAGGRARADALHVAMRNVGLAPETPLFYCLAASFSRTDLVAVWRLPRTLVVVHADEDFTALESVRSGHLSEDLRRMLSSGIGDETQVDDAPLRTAIVVRYGTGWFGQAGFVGFPTIECRPRREGVDESVLSALAYLLGELRAQPWESLVAVPAGGSRVETLSVATPITAVFRTAGIPSEATTVQTSLELDLVRHLAHSPIAIVAGPAATGKTTGVDRAARQLRLAAPTDFLDSGSEGPRLEALLDARELPEGVLVVDDLHRLPANLRDRLFSRAKKLVDHDIKHLPLRRMVLVGIVAAAEELRRFPDLEKRTELLSPQPTGHGQLIEQVVRRGARAAGIAFAHEAGLGLAARGWPLLAQRLAFETASAAGIARTSSSIVRAPAAPTESFAAMQRRAATRVEAVIQAVINLVADHDARQLALALLWWAGMRDAQRVSPDELPADWGRQREAWPTLQEAAGNAQRAAGPEWAKSIWFSIGDVAIEDVEVAATLPALNWERIGRVFGARATSGGLIEFEGQPLPTRRPNSTMQEGEDEGVSSKVEADASLVPSKNTDADAPLRRASRFSDLCDPLPEPGGHRARVSARGGSLAEPAVSSSPPTLTSLALRVTITPHQDSSIMSTSVDLIAVLAEEYPDVRDARAVWVRAGGRNSEVENIPRPRDLWQNLWLRSLRGANVRPAAVLKVALEDLPNNSTLIGQLATLARPADAAAALRVVESFEAAPEELGPADTLTLLADWEVKDEVDAFAAICPAMEGRLAPARRSEFRDTLTAIAGELKKGALEGVVKAGTSEAVKVFLAALAATAVAH
ncbi:MAG: hypothetical protein Q8P41_04785 [Pseudomonadota bacterium]|nr:hypothetical protein [Pseudomonadota bacterium]